MENKKNTLNLIDKASVVILSLLVLIFPLTFSTITTDPFSLPKELLLFVAGSVTLLLLGTRSVISESVRIRRTPFDLPVILFTLVVLASSVLAVNQSDALQTFVPFLFAPLIFFSITNIIKEGHTTVTSAHGGQFESSNLNLFIGSLGAGATILSLISVFSYLKIYALPFAFARTQTFSPFGSLFDQAIYLAIILGTVAYFAYPAVKSRNPNKSQLLFGAFSLIIVLGIAVSALGMVKLQPTQILPYETGFQTGLAAISQDSGRVFKSMALGSGFGTFFTDFSRYRPASLNLNPTLWSVSFFRSSSFVLELLATTGILGILTFLFICYRILKVRPIFVPAVLAFGLAFILPFSFASVFALFVVLGILCASRGLKAREKSQFFDIEVHLVAFKKGILSITDAGESREPAPQAPKALTGFVFAVIAVLIALTGFYMVRFAASDVIFQKSFNDVAQNNGSGAYDNQTRAINLFPSRDGYHRIFSQLNLTIANNLASSIPKGSSPSAQQQQTIYQLIQQSITSARTATTISPQTVTNWQNLSAVYRSLIGFGQNADTFAVVAAQQAATLDPNNPQEYITLGGIFYQLGQWDNAITQFQTAVNLKPDYANAYYNLGHAYEQKGDFKTALTEYETVKSLVANDKTNLDKINAEIAALQNKINSQGSETAATAPTNQLNVSEPPVQLPAQPSPVKIPGPNDSPTPTPSPEASATPSPAPDLGQ